MGTKNNGENNGQEALRRIAEIQKRLLERIPEDLLKDAPRKNADDVDTSHLISPYENLSAPGSRERLKRAQQVMDQELGTSGSPDGARNRGEPKKAATSPDPVSPAEPIPDPLVPESVPANPVMSTPPETPSSSASLEPDEPRGELKIDLAVLGAVMKHHIGDEILIRNQKGEIENDWTLVCLNKDGSITAMVLEKNGKQRLENFDVRDFLRLNAIIADDYRQALNTPPRGADPVATVPDQASSIPPVPDDLAKAMAQGPNQMGGIHDVTDAALAAAATGAVAASAEPKPDGVAEPKPDAGNPTVASPDASKAAKPPLQEVTVAGITVTGELAERISAARAALEQERRAFAQKEYEETNAWDNIKKTLGGLLKGKGREELSDLLTFRAWYENRLTDLNKLEIEALRQGAPEDRLKETITALVASKKFDEVEALDDMRRAARLEGKPKSFGDKLYRVWEFVAKGYNQLSFQQKFAIAGVMIGGAAALAAAGGAGITLGGMVVVGRQALGGSAAAVALEAAAERSATKARSKQSQKESAAFAAGLNAKTKESGSAVPTPEALRKAQLKALEQYLTKEVVGKTDEALQKRKLATLLRKSGAFFVGGVVGSGLIFQTEPGQAVQSKVWGGLKWLYDTAFDGFDYSKIDGLAGGVGAGESPVAPPSPGVGTPLEAGTPASAIPVESYAAPGNLATEMAEQAQVEAVGPPAPPAPITGSAALPEAPGETPGSWAGKIETPAPFSLTVEGSVKQLLGEYTPAKGDSLWKLSTDLARAAGLDETQANKMAVAVEALIRHKIETDPSLVGKAGFINADKLWLGEGKPFRLGALLDQGELEKIMQEARAGKVSLPPSMSGAAAAVDQAIHSPTAVAPAPSAPDIPTPGSNGALAAVETPSSTPLAPPGQTPEEIAVATGPSAPTDTPAPAPAPTEAPLQPKIGGERIANTLGTMDGQPATVPNPALEASQAEARPSRIAVPPPQELGKLSGIMSEKQLNTYLAHLPPAEQAAIHTRFTGLCRDIFALNPARVFSGDIPPNGLFDPLRNPRIMNAEVTTVLEHKLFATGTQNPLHSSQIARLEQLVQFAKDAFGPTGAPRPATQLLPAEKMQSYLIRVAALAERKNIPLPRLVTGPGVVIH